jgi:hypothetical protein
MRMRRVPVAIIAVIIAGAGLTACGGSGSKSPTASGSTSGGSVAAESTASASAPAPPTSAPATSAAATTPAATHSASALASPPLSVHATSSATQGSSGSGSFTVPDVSGDNIVSAYGSYAKTGARVKVTVCAKQTGSAFSVGAVAYAYNSSGATKNIGAVDLAGKGDLQCVSTTILFYTAHLKVHAFVGGTNGTIAKTGPTLTLY